MSRWVRRVVGVVAALLGAMAVAPGLFLLGTPSNHDPARCALRGADGTLQYLLTPSGKHWFGTDEQGCDMLARTVHAARISLGIAAMAIVTATVVGTVLGAVAGFARGWLDALITRSVEMFAGIPPIVFAVLVLSTRADDRPLWFVSVVLASVAVPSTAKIVRTAVLEVGGREYIEAAQASGAQPRRVLARHIGPNVAPVVLTYAFLGVGPAIGAETTLAFLGLSVDPPAAGWGVLVAEGLVHLRDRPNLLLIPGAFLIVTTLTFVTLGDLMERRLRPGSGKRSVVSLRSPGRSRRRAAAR